MDIESKRKTLVTAAIYLSFFASGVNFNILSPTLKRLAVVFTCDSVSIARVYTFRSFGYLIGTLLGSILFKSTSRQVSLGQLYLIVAGTLSIAPLTGNFIAGSILFAINGIATGICDVKTNVLLCKIWSDKSGPYIQAMYFSFACGCVVAPLLAGPFIASDSVQWLFVTAGVIIALSAAAMFASARVFVFDADAGDTGAGDSANSAPSVPGAVQYSIKSYRAFIEWMKSGQNRLISLTIVLISLMITAYSGVEIIYWEFLPTYLGQLPMNISEEDASYMSSGIKTGLMVSRGIGVAVAAFVSARVILTFDLILLAAACGTLILAQQSMQMIWLGNLAIASAFATIYPQIYSLVVSKFELNDIIGAIFCFSASLTAVILPEIVAHGLSNDSNFLILLVFICTSLTSFFFICAAFLMKKINDPRRSAAAEDTAAGDMRLESSHL